MRGLISLAVIFFVALSAQASAKKKNLGEKITIFCLGEITDKGSKDKSIPAATEFYLSYYVPTPAGAFSNRAFANQLDCGRTIAEPEITDVSITLKCDIGSYKIAAIESYHAARDAKTFKGSFGEYRKETGTHETKEAYIDRIMGNLSLKHVIGDKEYFMRGGVKRWNRGSNLLA